MRTLGFSLRKTIKVTSMGRILSYSQSWLRSLAQVGSSDFSVTLDEEEGVEGSHSTQ